MILLLFLVTVIVATPLTNCTRREPAHFPVFIPLDRGNSSKEQFISVQTINALSQPASAGVSAAVVDDPERKEPLVKQWQLSDCEAINSKQIQVVLEHFPYVQVHCEKQGSLLYPAVLDENSSSSGGTNVRERLSTLLGTYRFREFKVKAVSAESALTIPLAHCLQFSNERSAGKSEVRLAIAASPKSSTNGAFNVPIPFFGINSGISAGFGMSGAMYVNHVCNRRQASVRPFLSIRTVDSTISTREWSIKRYLKDYIGKSDWTDDEFTVLSNKAPIVSCVSELYVPGVCSWPNRPVSDERKRYFSSSFQAKL